MYYLKLLVKVNQISNDAFHNVVYRAVYISILAIPSCCQCTTELANSFIPLIEVWQPEFYLRPSEITCFSEKYFPFQKMTWTPPQLFLTIFTCGPPQGFIRMENIFPKIYVIRLSFLC